MRLTGRQADDLKTRLPTCPGGPACVRVSDVLTEAKRIVLRQQMISVQDPMDSSSAAAAASAKACRRAASAAAVDGSWIQLSGFSKEVQRRRKENEPFLPFQTPPAAYANRNKSTRARAAPRGPPGPATTAAQAGSSTICCYSYNYL